MKKLIIIVLAVISAKTYSQTITTSVGIEKTVAGNQYSVLLSRETVRNWSFGLFYQEDLNVGAKAETPQAETNAFYGTQVLMPIARSQRLVFSANLRTGVINNKFFVMVPGVETRINFSARYGFVAGAGYRMGYPSFSAKLFMKLF